MQGGPKVHAGASGSERSGCHMGKIFDRSNLLRVSVAMMGILLFCRACHKEAPVLPVCMSSHESNLHHMFGALTPRAS